MSGESGWKAMGYTIGISEIPLMILLGYVIGRRLGRELEGIIFGGVLGVVLLSVYMAWAYKKTKAALSAGGKSSAPPTR